MLWLIFAACIAEGPTVTKVSETSPSAVEVDPILGGLRARPISYTRHGRCRMDCRSISEAEVEEMLLKGEVDPGRTRMDGECPSYAVEGVTSDEQHVRIVYAACPTKTKVVTAIDLGRDWPCGDC